MQGPKRAALLFAVTLVVAVLAAMPAARAETVTGDLSRTDIVADRSWDAFELVIPSGKEASIRIVAQGDVDFYEFTASSYESYERFSGIVPFERSKENAREFSHSVQTSGHVVVVDNRDYSSTGATPTGPVLYTVTIEYRDPLNPLVVCGIMAVGAFGVGALGVILQGRRKAKRKAMTPPPPEAPPPPP